MASKIITSNFQQIFSMWVRDWFSLKIYQIRVYLSSSIFLLNKYVFFYNSYGLVNTFDPSSLNCQHYFCHHAFSTLSGELSFWLRIAFSSSWDQRIWMISPCAIEGLWTGLIIQCFPKLLDQDYDCRIYFSLELKF